LTKNLSAHLGHLAQPPPEGTLDAGTFKWDRHLGQTNFMQSPLSGKTQPV